MKYDGYIHIAKNDDGSIEVTRADPYVRLGVGLLENVDPDLVILDGTHITIKARSGTYRYRLMGGSHGYVNAKLVSTDTRARHTS